MRRGRQGGDVFLFAVSLWVYISLRMFLMHIENGVDERNTANKNRILFHLLICLYYIFFVL